MDKQHLHPLKKTCLAISIIKALAISPSFAATIVVDSSGESGTACSLRNAVESINISQNVGGCVAINDFGTDDTINFSVSTVNVLDTELRIINDVSINPGGNFLTINANAFSRVLSISNSAVTIENLIVSGGQSSANSDGGGISARDSQLTLQNVVLRNNTADDDGGGLYAEDCQVFINDSQIINNNADDGGGLYVRDSNVTIRDSIISGNTTVTIGDDGGGLYARSGTVSVTNTTISDNSADDDGGGIFVRESTLTFSNSTLSGNRADDDGGGINVGFSANASIIHSTLANNSADRVGGGIAVASGSLTLSNSLIVGNSAGDGVLSTDDINLSVVGSLNFLGVNLVGDSSKSESEAFNFSPQNSVILATSDSRQATPLTSIIAPLTTSPLRTGDQVTPTHALVSGSPAIDAANNNICSASPINTKDQRRLQRTELCDIGAFEFGATKFRNTFTAPPILFLLLNEQH